MHRQIIGKICGTLVYLICDRDRLIELEFAGENIVATEVVSAREAVYLQVRCDGDDIVLEAMWPSQGTRGGALDKGMETQLDAVQHSTRRDGVRVCPRLCSV